MLNIILIAATANKSQLIIILEKITIQIVTYHSTIS